MTATLRRSGSAPLGLMTVLTEPARTSRRSSGAVSASEMIRSGWRRVPGSPSGAAVSRS